MAARTTYGQMKVSVQIMRRDLLPPLPGSGEPRHAYTAILTTQAKVKSRSGASEFSRVDINGKIVTHTFTIRYTTIPFDVRNRLRVVGGGLYQILTVENVDLGNEWFNIHCASVGNEDTEAAR